MGDLLPPELLPHEVRGREDARVLLPSQPLAVWQQGGGDVAHHYPPGVAIALGGEDAVVDRVREPAEDAGGEQERLAAVVLRVVVDPVRTGHDSLGDETSAVGEQEALEDVPGPAGRDDRLVLGDLAQAGDEPRVEQNTAGGGRVWRSRARRGGIRPVALDVAVAEEKVVALAHRRTSV